MRNVFSKRPGTEPEAPVAPVADEPLTPVPPQSPSDHVATVEAALETYEGEEPTLDSEGVGVAWGPWEPDLALPDYQMRRMRLIGVAPLVEEGDVELTATLVRRNPRRHERAVLYLHGWNDYFFQTHLADVWDALGYDFYALDLRRYGRNLAGGLLPGYVSNLADYDLEIDAAMERVSRHHDQVVLCAHSTGGLTAVLWADRHPGALAGVVLNSPWIELQGSALMRTLAGTVAKGLATRAATWAIPMADSGVYGNSLHTSGGGEWDWDLDLKRNPSNPVRPGWLRAILRGHEQVAAGLHIDCPVLMLVSARSDFRRSYDGPVLDADMVLDVDRLASRAPNLGWHVTLVRVDGGVHDLVLSPEGARGVFFDELVTWERAYLRDDRKPIDVWRPAKGLPAGV